MIYFDVETDRELRNKANKERLRLVNRVISQKIKNPEDDSKNDESRNSKEETVQLSKRPRWLPVISKPCTTITRGLYHNGKSLHTCTSGKCCQSK